MINEHDFLFSVLPPEMLVGGGFGWVGPRPPMGIMGPRGPMRMMGPRGPMGMMGMPGPMGMMGGPMGMMGPRPVGGPMGAVPGVAGPMGAVPVVGGPMGVAPMIRPGPPVPLGPNALMESTLKKLITEAEFMNVQFC